MPPYAPLKGEDDPAPLKDEDGRAATDAAAAAAVLASPYVDGVYGRVADGVAEWGASDVEAWLERVGMGLYGRSFKRHEITGKQLHRLSEAHLVELGVDTIGHRIAIQTEISKLHSELSDAVSETIVWASTAAKSYHGGIDWFYKKKIRPTVRKLICQRPGFLDEYTLTSSVLVVRQREREVSEVCCGGRLVRTTTRHVPLETITSATASTSTATRCDFGEADEIIIELDKMRTQRPIQPLVVTKGEGLAIVAIIMDAVHKRKALSEAPAVLPPQSMRR